MEEEKQITIDTTCQYIKANGERCSAKRQIDSRFCFFHDPLVALQRADAQRKGGLNRYARGEPGNYVIESPRDILGVLVDALNQATALPNTAGRAKAIGYLVSIILKGFEQTDLENRVKALEERILKG